MVVAIVMVTVMMVGCYGDGRGDSDAYGDDGAIA